MLRIVVLAGLILSVVGCSSTARGPYLAEYPVSPESLLAGEVLFGDRAKTLTVPEDDILDTDAAMESFLDFIYPSGGSSEYRARVLATSLADPGLFGLNYQERLSLTARDTFHRRSGNCVSFTNLFVALARKAGLRVYYQQAYVTPTWESEGGLQIMSRHVNALVKLHDGKGLTVDFDQTETGVLFDHQKVPDRRAFALFYSNIGVEFLQADNDVEAFRYLKKAVLTDQQLGSTWVNLGALYSRKGFKKEAETAYLVAARRDPGELLAYSNLSRIYESAGVSDKSEFFAQKARKLREQNPYFHYGLAQKAYQLGHYSESNQHLRRALKLKDDEPLFVDLMAKNSQHLAVQAVDKS